MAAVADTLATRLAPAGGLIRRIAREPLVHFLMIGALLFAGLQGVRAMQRPTVRISETELNQLVQYWTLQSGRPPTRAELSGILRDRVDEELLAAEARRLGLDRDDLIVRRRLAQKMAFASEDVGALPEPTDARLRELYARTQDRYASPAHIALRQAYFSAERGRAALTAAGQALARARAGAEPAGDPFVLPLAYADVSLDDLTRDYGVDFARAVQAAPLGAWIGPVASPYGQHLLRVESRSGASVAPFDSVRADLRDAWLSERRAQANAAFLAGLRRRYRVVVAGEAP